jgi:hypothetical protein
MAVKFISTIKEDGIGGWYIELLNTQENKIATCKNIRQYEDAVEQMGDEYGGDIEVQWKKDDNVTITHFEEVKIEIGKYQQQYNQEAMSSNEI